MTLEEFETIIYDAVKNLPNEFKEILEKNQIALIPREDVPQPLKDKYRNTVVFGIFIGVPYGKFVNYQLEPTRIELYKESFEEYYPGGKGVKEQIIKTVVHEIAHYFGFSEEKIRKLGY
jgi:predicted Zn-dependent protease with MMP-like domain